MALPSIRQTIPVDRLRPLLGTFTHLRIVPGDSTLQCEVERAPDSGGSPGTYVPLGTFGPFPKSGGDFLDPRPSDGATWWYRARHVSPKLSPGTYITAISGVARAIDETEMFAILSASSPYSRTEDINAAAVTPTEAQTRSRCKVTNSVPQNLPHGSTTTLTFDTETADVGALHSTSANTGRITIPTGGNVGFWILHACCRITAHATVTFMILRIVRNGATDEMVLKVPINTSGSDGTSGMCLIAAPSVGDYFEATVQIDGGGGSTSTGGPTFFEAIHVW